MWKVFIAVMAMSCAGAVNAGMTKGVVVYDKGCGSRMIIETRMGYVLAEWFGGSTPAKGDTLIGDLEAFGLKDLYISNQDAKVRVWIDDYMLSQSRVVEKLRAKCR